MKIDLTHLLKKAADETVLTDSERAQLERVVLGYMSMKPRTSAVARSRTTLSRVFMWRGYVAAGLVVAIASSGTISYAAESSLPGDVLYPIKVHVNEQLALTLTRTPQERVALETRLAGKRLDEAAHLAVEGRLTPEHQELLTQTFSEHAENVAEDAEHFSDEDEGVAINVATSFESELSSHESILKAVDEGGNTDSLKRAIREKASRLSQFRFKAEGRAFVSANVEEEQPVATMAVAAVRTMNAPETDTSKNLRASTTALMMGDVAKKSYANASLLFDTASPQFEQSRIDQIREELTSASQGIAEGDTYFASQRFADAFHAYQESLATSQKLSVFLRTARDFSPRTIPKLQFHRTNRDTAPEEILLERNHELHVLPKPLILSPFESTTDDDHVDEDTHSSGTGKDTSDDGGH